MCEREATSTLFRLDVYYVSRANNQKGYVPGSKGVLEYRRKPSTGVECLKCAVLKRYFYDVTNNTFNNTSFPYEIRYLAIPQERNIPKTGLWGALVPYWLH
jgi:hypothetical protein